MAAPTKTPLTKTPPPRPTVPVRLARRRPSGLILTLVVVIAVALTGMGLAAAFLLRGSPDAVDVDTATAAVSDTTDTSTTAGIDGTWTIDTDVAAFDVNDTTGTFVGFRVAEVLSDLGSVEAVGRTGAVSGTVTIDGTTLIAADLTADVTQMVSNDSRREDNIDEALESSVFPTATFTSAGPVDLGSDLSDGAVATVDVPGALSIHGVTTDVTVTMSIVRTGDIVVVTGTTPIAFSDVGVVTPSSRIVVSLEDAGDIEFQLYLTRG